MLKKLCVLVLAICSSYAMEDITTTPTGDENIKQTVEEVKQTIENTQTADDNKDKVNEVADDFSILNIDKMVEQLNNIKVEDKKQNCKKVKYKDSKIVNEIKLSYKTDGQRLFKLKKLKTKWFKNMTDDEKDWMRLIAYDMFSKTCKIFIEKLIKNEVVSKEEQVSFYRMKELRCCVLTGLNPQQIFLDEIKFNFNPECYKNKECIQKQFELISKTLVPVAEIWHKRWLNAGCLAE